MKQLLIFLLLSSYLWADAFLQTQTFSGTIPLKSVKELRDQGIVKQGLDYSCGASSVATILTYFYNRPTTELELLFKINAWAGGSFADIARVLPEYGYKGIGLALSAEQLRNIKIPAIVYLKKDGQDHFSVLNGINSSKIYLADPSWGNIRFSWYRFLQMWEIRDSEDAKGKVLLIVPNNKTLADADLIKEFFNTEERHYFDTESLLYRQPHKNF